MGGNHPTCEKGIKEVAASVFPQNDKPAANNQVGAANGTVVATLEDGWQGNRRHPLGIQLVGAAAAVASRPCVHRCRRIVGSATRDRPRGLCAGRYRLAITVGPAHTITRIFWVSWFDRNGTGGRPCLPSQKHPLKGGAFRRARTAPLPGVRARRPEDQIRSRSTRRRF
jgi:hypothetical protein